jgi:hypothetical protein
MEEEGKRACCLTDQRQHAVCTEAAVSNLVNRLGWKGFIGNIERLYWQHRKALLATSTTTLLPLLPPTIVLHPGQMDLGTESHYVASATALYAPCRG